MSQEKKVIGIVLTEKTVVSFLLQVSLDSVNLLTQAKPLLFSAKNLIDKVDESLQELGPESEDVNEVVFVFDHHWHDGMDVFADRQKEIDKLLEELSLTDLGFVTLEETVSESLVQQNANLSALVSIISKTDISVSVFRESKQICNEIVGRSNDFRGDMVEAAARLVKTCGQDQHLPHKFILLSMELSPLEMEKLHQLLLETDWQAHGFFLQLPEVEIVSREVFLSQITDQVGRVIQNLLVSTGLSAKPEEVKPETVAPVVASAAEALDQASSQAVSALNTPPASSVDTSQVDTASVDDQQKSQTAVLPSTHPDTAAPESTVPASATAAGSNLATESAKASAQPTEAPTQAVTTDYQSKAPLVSHQSQSTSTTPSSKSSPTPAKASFFSRLKSFLGYHWHSMDDRSKKPFAIFGFVLGLVALVVLGWLTFLKQFQLTVNVTPAEKTLTKELKVSLSQTATKPDTSGTVLPAKSVKKVVEVSDVTQATGEKNVGDKAEGKVKLTNKTTTEKTLSQGTKLISDDSKGLEFELTSTVTVPAATVEDTGDQETKTFGTKEITIKAKEPGEESNLPKDTKFKIDGVSTNELVAASTDDFSGGTSKNTTIVTKEDLDRLRKSLLEDARAEAEKQFNDQQNHQVLFSPPTKLKVLSETASHKVGEETDEVKLTLKVEVTALSFNKDDLNRLVEQEFNKDLSSDLDLVTDSINVLTKFATDQDKQSQTPTLVVSATAKARYRLDKNAVAKEIAGRYLNEAESVLAKDEKIAQFQLSFRPSFARRLVKRLPTDPNEIVVKVN